MTLVLASASESRAAVLAAAGVAFDVVPADLDEDETRRAMADATPAAIALALAERKAAAISARRPADLVIGGDQVLAFDGGIVNKCGSLAEARTLLLRLRGRQHHLHGGLALARDAKVIWRHQSTVELVMRSFSEGFLDDHLRREGKRILSSVGAYRLEGAGAQLIARFTGSYFAVLGLDLLPLLEALRAEGAIER